jgi:Ca2+/Na+ antiporter
MLEIQQESGHVLYLNHLISFIITVAYAMYPFRMIHLKKIDKFLHTVISAGIVFVLFHLFHFIGILDAFWWLCPVIVIVIGFAKEVADRLNKKKKLFDWEDILADVLGVIAVTLVYIFSFSCF